MRQRIAFLLIMVLLVSGLSGNMSVIYAADEAMEPFSIDYTEEGYSVVTEVTEVWNNGYNIRITIHNTSDEIIHNWGILLETKDEIHDLYNAQELSNEEGIRLFRNNVYNQDIPAGGSVMFGYTGYYTEEMDVPEEYAVSSFETAVDCEAFAVNYIMCDSWDGGAIAQILIENTSDKAIEDWMLEFDSGIEIAEIWDAELVSHVGGHYVIRNVPYQHNIMAGGMVVAGMRLLEAPDTDGEEEILTNVVVREILPDGSGQGNSGEGVPSVSDNEVPGQGEDVSGNVVPDEDIVHLETGDGAGEIYYKTAYSDDVVSDPIGLPCIRNQFLLSADDTVSFRDVEDYLSGLGAVIVGYIEATNDYQVEMIEDTDVDAIQELTERISNEAWVRYAGFNYLWLEEPCFTVSDPWSEELDDEEETFDTVAPKGYNWGLEAIDFEGALINAGVISSSQTLPEAIRINHLTTVKMGLLDSMFDEWHEDLTDNFVMTWLNFEKQEDMVNSYHEKEDQENQTDILGYLSHGTHVAGIMCAGFNNGVGISGICIKNELYGFALDTSENNELVNRYDIEDSTFYAACGLSMLILNDVKVINYSMGMNEGIVYAASIGTEEGYTKVVQYLDKQSSYIEDVLERFLHMGYDFLIVTSAGNGNNGIYYQCAFVAPYIGGYISEADAEKELADNQENNKDNNDEFWIDDTVSYNTENIIMDARYESVFNYIPESSPCYDHIICVGSIGYDEIATSYEISDFSNAGDRVDIYAPGEDIYSTYLTGCASNGDLISSHNYTRLSGTSMAAPHVSGTAGLAYNVAPDLGAAELKQIIISNVELKDGIKVLNAGNVIFKITTPVQLHVTDAQGRDISNAEIEIRDFSSYYFKLLGGIYALPAVGDKVICRNIMTDQLGIADLHLQPGTYYAVVKDDSNTSGVNYLFRVNSQNIENHTVYEVVLEPFNDTETYPLTLQFNPAGTDSILDNVTVRFYKRWNDDEELYMTDNGEVSFTIDKDGNICIDSLPKGAYMVEISNGGVLSYSNIIVVESDYNRVYYSFRL